MFATLVSPSLTMSNLTIAKCESSLGVFSNLTRRILRASTGAPRASVGLLSRPSRLGLIPLPDPAAEMAVELTIVATRAQVRFTGSRYGTISTRSHADGAKLDTRILVAQLQQVGRLVEESEP
jgi:hypothetical protein